MKRILKEEQIVGVVDKSPEAYDDMITIFSASDLKAWSKKWAKGKDAHTKALYAAAVRALAKI